MVLTDGRCNMLQFLACHLVFATYLCNSEFTYQENKQQTQNQTHIRNHLSSSS